ncbi:hypothetical protein [Haladaptatus salinisoli]|uniref:hypothetical protein n=1 Tax=Haladaptatus salinisoli TaxID=2884876 RepID=UPI001D0A330C|nr:hypothetical protein [Haladaptatus salinisoli]
MRNLALGYAYVVLSLFVVMTLLLLLFSGAEPTAEPTASPAEAEPIVATTTPQQTTTMPQQTTTRLIPTTTRTTMRATTTRRPTTSQDSSDPDTTAAIVEAALISKGISVYSVTERDDVLYVVYETKGTDEVQLASEMGTITGAYAGVVSSTDNPPDRLVATIVKTQGRTHYELGYYYVEESWARGIATGEYTWEEVASWVFSTITVHDDPIPISVDEPSRAQLSLAPDAGAR